MKDEAHHTTSALCAVEPTAHVHATLCLVDAPPPRTGPIDTRALEDIRKDPYSLPASFQWSDLNLDNDEEVGVYYMRSACHGTHTTCALHGRAAARVATRPVAKMR